eukprot:scaffold83872_cov18-Prasinocladus_malaysianus.AAC.1
MYVPTNPAEVREAAAAAASTDVIMQCSSQSSADESVVTPSSSLQILTIQQPTSGPFNQRSRRRQLDA